MALPSSWLTDRIVVEQRLDHLCEFQLLDSPGGSAATLYCSRRGFATPPGGLTSDLGDSLTGNILWDKRIAEGGAPDLKRNLWASGKVGGMTSSEPFTVKLKNGDGGLDSLRSYQWRGRPFYYYAVDVLDPTDRVKRFFRGTVVDVLFGLDFVDVKIEGREAIFDQPTSRARYRGTGPYMLELDSGGSSNISRARYTATASTDPASTNGPVTWEGWFYFDTFGTSIYRLFGWVGTTEPFSLTVFDSSSGQLRVRGSVSSSFETHSWTLGTGDGEQPALVAGRWYHIACRIDEDGNSDIVLWDDHLHLEYLSGTLGTFTGTRDLATASTSHLDFNANNQRQVWGDELRIWTTYRTLDEIRSMRHAPIDQTDYPDDLVALYDMSDASGTTVSDVLNSQDMTISTGAGASSTWIRHAQGQPEHAGKSKPMCWGKKYGQEPEIIDAAVEVHQIAAGEVSSIDVYEGGNQVTAGTAHTDRRSFLTTTPTAGQVDTFLEDGLFKLGSSPTLPVLCHVEGFVGEGTKKKTNTAGLILRDIAEGRLDTPLTWPDDFDIDALLFQDDHWGGMLRFDGTKDYGQIAHASSLLWGGGWLGVRVTFRLASFVGNSGIIAKTGLGGSDEWALYIDGSDRLRCYVRESGTSTTYGVFGQILGASDLDVWHQAWLIWDGSNVQLFYDGVEVPSSPNAFAGTGINNSRDVCIGALSLGAGVSIDGEIAEVAIFANNSSASGAWDSTDVAFWDGIPLDVIQPSFTKYAVFADLQCLLRFNKRTSTTAIDETTNKNDATLNTDAIWAVALEPIEMGGSWDDAPDCREVVDAAFNSVNGYWGFIDDDDTIKAATFEGPALEADWDFDERHIVKLSPIETSTHLHELELRYRIHDRSLSEDEIAGARLGTDWGDWSRGFRSIRLRDEDIFEQYPPPASKAQVVESLIAAAGNEHQWGINRPPVVSETAYPDSPYRVSLARGQTGYLGAIAAAKQRWEVYKQAPRAFRAFMTVEAADVKLGQTVSLSYSDLYGRARLGLDGTANFIVLRVRLALQHGRVVLDLWGYEE